MPVPSQRAYDLAHIANIKKYSAQVRRSYNAAIKEISALSFVASLNKNNEFYFRNHTQLNKKVNKVLKDMYNSVYGTTVSGVNTAWDLAVEKNNELARYVFGRDLKDLPVAVRDEYFSTNAGARRAFLARKSAGLGLSKNVWNNTAQFKQQMELALEVGIGKGKSAQALAKDVQKHLNAPDLLFRRVKDQSGVLRLSKAAKAFNPGAGRYRSSYKNALRLTRNETNFSYERSQHKKRQQQSFIVGVEIRVSPSHIAASDKGGISCLSLQGKYPKDFDFTHKWHVNCICMSLNILKSRDELDIDVQRILSGKEPFKTSKNAVKGLSKNYTNYVTENTPKYANWKSQPRTFETNNGLIKAPVKKA